MENTLWLQGKSLPSILKGRSGLGSVSEVVVFTGLEVPPLDSPRLTWQDKTQLSHQKLLCSCLTQCQATKVMGRWFLRKLLGYTQESSHLSTLHSLPSLKTSLKPENTQPWMVLNPSAHNICILKFEHKVAHYFKVESEENIQSYLTAQITVLI